MPFLRLGAAFSYSAGSNRAPLESVRRICVLGAVLGLAGSCVTERDMKHGLPKAILTFVAMLAPTSGALAHTGAGVAVGLQSGFLHPVTGLDHLVAMVAVGLWGAQLGSPAIFILPITFPLVMAFGGLLGIVGFTLPFAETAIALSGIALGLLVTLRARPPLAVAMLIVGAFAIFHGYAHGRELPNAADPLAYAV